ncbi:MAG: AAA family ATPase [bacterium]|nr:AAA family ATPase [bacterium]
MSKIIALANQKGGTAKTTTAVNLAAYLAALGKSTLLVDLDPQSNTTSSVGIASPAPEPHIYQALIGQSQAKSIIHQTPIFGFDVIPAGIALAGALVELTGLANREFRLYNLLKPIKANYDFILIDTPPSLGLLTLNGLAACDEVIIPVQCEYLALEGIAQLLETVNLINKNLKKNIKVLGALLVMYDRMSRLNRAVAKEMRRNFPGYIFNAVIPRNISLAEAPSFGKTILQFAPYSHGAKAYRQLAQEIINLENPCPTTLSAADSNRLSPRKIYESESPNRLI